MPVVTLCRLCGALAPGMMSVDGDDNLRQQINQYVPIKIANIEGFPNTICEKCCTHLAQHSEFVDACAITARDIERRVVSGCVANAEEAAKKRRSSQMDYEEDRPATFKTKNVVEYTLVSRTSATQ